MVGYAAIKYVEATLEHTLQQILDEISVEFMADAAIVSVEVVASQQGNCGLENTAIEIIRGAEGWRSVI